MLLARRTKVLFGLVFLVTGGLATKGAANTIPVLNNSFETLGAPVTISCGTGCLYNAAAIPDWTKIANSAGQMRPGTQSLFHSVPNGITVIYVNNGNISQTIPATVGTVHKGVDYKLTVDFGLRTDKPTQGASADLLVGGVMYRAIGTPPSSGNWSPFTAEFIGSAANAGDTITIQLNASGTQGNFDNVQLVATPEPAYLGLVGFGVAGLLAFALRNHNA